VEISLTGGLKNLGTYYDQNRLTPTPVRQKLVTFTYETMRPTPPYLGVTLDRSLNFKTHIDGVKQKVFARNNILRKMSGTTWGADLMTMRITALALCYSSGEWASPKWSRSSHSKQIDVALNDTCRLVTRCMKATPADKLYLLSGIVPPSVRREVSANSERSRQ